MDTAVIVPAVDSRTYAIDRAVEPLRWVFRWISLAMLLAMVSLPFVQVIAREIFSSPIVGMEELTRFMLICSVLLALPYVISSGANIRMEEIITTLPKGVLQKARIVICLIAAVTFGTMAVASAVAIGTNLDNSTPTLGIPYWIFLGAALLSFSMSALECAIQTIKAIQDRPLYITFPQEEEPEEELDLPETMRV
jgi:TRAP-type C4-dicarboxylate transport system permease small subunit